MGEATRGEWLTLDQLIGRLEAIRTQYGRGDLAVRVTDGDDTYGFAVAVNDETVDPPLVVLDTSVVMPDAE